MYNWTWESILPDVRLDICASTSCRVLHLSLVMNFALLERKLTRIQVSESKPCACPSLPFVQS